MPALHPYLDPETWQQTPPPLAQQIEEMRSEVLALSEQVAQILLALHGVIVIGIDKAQLPACVEPKP